MKAILQTYRSLLADVSRISGFVEIRGLEFDLHWCLNEAPKLEKCVLRSIEHGESLDLMMWPAALRRLASASVTDADSLRLLRQLLLFSYKANVTHSSDLTAQVVSNYLSVNSVVGEFGASLFKQEPKLLDRVRQHVQSVLYKFRHRNIIPMHGPGASTTPKQRWTMHYSTIETCYPYSDYFCLYFNRDHCSQLPDTYTDLIDAKLIAVPKDSRGPRLICVHPAESIWIQQGLRKELERVISLYRRSPGAWPRGHVNFDDQTVNGSLALAASQDRKYATLDLKEASDRVSDILVQYLFGRYYKYFGCCRAHRVMVADHANAGAATYHNINSYAPMGNATTFPVQSLVFWAICVASMQSRGFHQPDSVFVFGDDILVPTECAEGVIDDLQAFGLLVNKDKSFWRGSFRESCGVDAFNGKDVTPVRWKSRLDTVDMFDIQSLCDMAMRLRIAGYLETSITVYAIARHKLRVRYKKELFLTNNPHHGGIAEYSENAYYVWRDAYWHRDTQQYVSPIWRIREMKAKAFNCDWNHVLESLCSLEQKARSNVPNRTPPRGSRLDLGWMPVL